MRAGEAGVDEKDLYVIDLGTGVPTRLTRGQDISLPGWSPDDAFVYYRNRTPEGLVVMRRRADASAPAELVLADLATVGRARQRYEKQAKSGDKHARHMQALLAEMEDAAKASDAAAIHMGKVRLAGAWSESRPLLRL